MGSPIPARSARALFWLRAGLFGTSAVGMAVPVVANAVQHGEAAIICTNPVSGASWQIKVDYDRGLVDLNPARINDGQISWHDPKDGGNYTLDRKSGNLTVIVASSTGGYFIHDRCNLEN